MMVRCPACLEKRLDKHGVESWHVLHGVVGLGCEFIDMDGLIRRFKDRPCVSVESGAWTCERLMRNSSVASKLTRGLRRLAHILYNVLSLCSAFSVLYVVHASVLVVCAVSRVRLDFVSNGPCPLLLYTLMYMTYLGSASTLFPFRVRR